MAQTPADGVGTEGVFLTFAKLVAYIGPFFFIPAAFKFAGGAFANLAGMANDRSKGLFDRQRKWRGERRKDRKEQIAADGFLRKTGRLGRTDFGKKINSLAASPYDLKNAVKRDGLIAGLSKTGLENSQDRKRIHEQGLAAKDEVVATKGLNDNFLQMLENIMKGLSDEALRADLVKHGVDPGSASLMIAQGKNMYDQYGHGLVKIISDGKAASKTSQTNGYFDHLKNIAANVHGDEAMAAELVGSGTGAFNQAGMLDMAGGSFGEKMAMAKAVMNMVENNGVYTGDDTIDYYDELTGTHEKLNLSSVKDGSQSLEDLVNTRQKQKGRDSMGTWDWGRVHPSSVKRTMSDIHSGITETSSKLRDKSLPVAEREKNERLLGQQIAELDSLRTNAMASGNNEVKRLVADALDGGTPLNIGVDGTPYNSVAELVEATGKGALGAGVTAGYKSVGRMGGMTPEEAERYRLMNEPPK
jgi:hypothetical protein